jgi:formylglycine-generating enzyme required for sulfatase activity
MEPDANHCNYNRNVGQPTPVTRYPMGASPYGVMDMSGNVAEWCLTEWGMDRTTLDGNNRRVVRGGGWGHYVVGGLRAALRGRNFPNLVELNTGFRLALLV